MQFKSPQHCLPLSASRKNNPCTVPGRSQVQNHCTDATDQYLWLAEHVTFRQLAASLRCCWTVRDRNSPFPLLLHSCIFYIGVQAPCSCFCMLYHIWLRTCAASCYVSCCDVILVPRIRPSDSWLMSCSLFSNNISNGQLCLSCPELHSSTWMHCGHIAEDFAV